MAKTEETNTTVQALSTFASARGVDISQVFDHFLEYIVWAHTIPEYGKPIKGWPYKPEAGKELYNIYVGLLKEVQPLITKHGWYDIFGTMYEALIAGKSRRSNNGQFFTPSTLCDLMIDISVAHEDNPVGKRISDPTCGSGRNLLAFNAKYPGNYHVAEDLDKTCCLMTVCNFLIHGVNGEVIWHNTLHQDWKGGWRVNQGLNNPFYKYYGVPHVRPMEESEWQSPLEKKEEVKQEQSEQASLFD